MVRPARRVLRWLVPAVVLLLVGAAAVAVALRGDPADDPAGGAAHVRVDGDRLVDSRTGAAFTPRGVSWSSFEYACAQGWGYSALDSLLGGDPYTGEAEAIARWGANTVRLPLNQDCWLGTRGAPVSDQHDERSPQGYRAEVRRFVDALHRAGLVVVLDLHSRKRLTAPEFGNLAMPDPESLAFWTSVATAYRDDPSVMFDAFNEPYSRYDGADRLVFELTWPCWRDGGCGAPVEDDRTATDGRVTFPVQGMARVVSTIRDAGAEQPVLLGGLDYANDLEHWLEFAPDDDQLVASFHAYDFKACADRACWDRVLAPLADSVPVITGELGAEDPLDGFVEDYLAWAADHGIGSLFWVWADHAGDPMSLLAEAPAEPTEWGRLAARLMGGSAAVPSAPASPASPAG